MGGETGERTCCWVSDRPCPNPVAPGAICLCAEHAAVYDARQRGATVIVLDDEGREVEVPDPTDVVHPI